ncbi:hypothetical protein BBG47_20040 [Paenibacillus sp. KS1]|uniref:hypothetical protein n=1 Tax=Paenibacillus sp. KS1 TaxID=1849249 RepID=UPI000806659D|nr:hypothetical protein [Paenibacillus sp. KS1]OBY77783.1 hypothetical protein BBG47_20040 [Paenibacillus sp. KS1]
MNKKAAIAMLSCSLSLVFLFIYVWESQQVTASEDQVTSKMIVKEAMTAQEHFVSYVMGDTVYMEDLVKQSIEPLRKATGEVFPAMHRVKGTTAINNFTYLANQMVIDPVSLQIGMERSIPYTYTATIEQSSKYIDTLLYDGWELIGSYNDHRSMDMYLRKNGRMARVIILERMMKVFDDVKRELPDSKAFVK